MAFIDAPDDGVVSADFGEPDLGTTTDTDTPEAEQVEEADPQVEEVDEPTYTFLMDGEEVQLTHSQAQQAMLRQADYTRKTQELAEQRKELEHAEAIMRALETDPERTLPLIAQQFGMQVNAPAQPEQPSWDDMDPDERRWAQFDAFVQQQEQREAQAEIDRSLAALHSTHGEFDENSLMKFALDHEIGDLNVAYDVMWARSMREAAAKQKADSAVVDRKKAAPPVAGGHNVQAGAVTPGSAPSSSIEEAFAQSKAQLGL